MSLTGTMPRRRLRSEHKPVDSIRRFNTRFRSAIVTLLKPILKFLIRQCAERAPSLTCRSATRGFVPGVRYLSRQTGRSNSRVVPNSRVLHSAWTAQRYLPQILSGEAGTTFVDEQTHALPEVNAAVIPNGRVHGIDGVTFDEEGYLIAEPARQLGYGPCDWSELYHWRRPQVRKLPGRWGVLTGVGSTGYFHWMLDVLPRFPLIKEVAPTVDGWLVPGIASPFLAESLQFAGIEGRIEYLSSNDHVQADEIVVSSPPSVSGNPPRWVGQFLKGLANESAITNESGSDRIFISRGAAKARRMRNEHALSRKLETLGFKVVCLEALSLQQQIELFSNATTIIAPHGAGLTNLAFSKPGARVLEIFNPTYINATFWALGCLNSLDYFCLISEEAVSATYTTHSDIQLSGREVDLICDWATTRRM